MVGLELHRRVRRPALGLRPQVRGVAEQLGQRHRHADGPHARALLDVLDPAAARRDVAHHVPRELLGRDDLEGHHRLQEHGVGLPGGVPQRDLSGELERQLRGVHLMVRAVDQRGTHVDHGVPGQDAGLQRLLDPLVHRRDVLPRDRPTDDLVDELVAAARARGFEVDLHHAVLAMAAGLADVAPHDLVDGSADRLPVGHLRLADVRSDVELAGQPVDQDLQVQLAHPGDQRLARLVVELDQERRVLVGQLGQGHGELVLVGLRLRLDGHRDDRGRERHRLEHHRLGRVGQRVAGGRVLQPHHGHDVAGERGILVLAVVRVHLQDAADPLLAVAGGVLDVGARAQDARVHPEVREPPHVRVRHDLEHQRGERFVVRRAPFELLTGLGVRAHDRRHVDRGRQVLDHRVQQRLDALVPEGRTAQHRRALPGQGDLAQDLAQLLRGGLLAVDVLLEQPLVVVGQLLEQQVVRLLGGRPQLVGDVAILPFLAQPVGGPEVALHLDQVDDPVEPTLDAPRQLDHERRGVEAVADHLDRAFEVGARAVHLVDEADPGDPVAVGLAPHRLGLGLHPGHRVEHGHRAVQDAQGAFDLHREVDVARRVDQVDPVVLPHARGGGGGDGDAPLPLLDHPVHLGGALVDLPDLVGLARVVQDPLGRGGLARVDVGHDPDVPGPGQRVLTDQQTALAGRSALPLPGDLRCLCHVFQLPRRDGHRYTASPRNAGPGGPATVPSSSTTVVTTGSGRTPCSPRPSCACPRAASRTRPGRSTRPSARPPVAQPWCARGGRARC